MVAQQPTRHPSILAQAAQTSDGGVVQPSSSTELLGPARYSAAAFNLQPLALHVQEEIGFPVLSQGRAASHYHLLKHHSQQFLQGTSSP